MESRCRLRGRRLGRHLSIRISAPQEPRLAPSHGSQCVLGLVLASSAELSHRLALRTWIWWWVQRLLLSQPAVVSILLSAVQTGSVPARTGSQGLAPSPWGPSLGSPRGREEPHVYAVVRGPLASTACLSPAASFMYLPHTLYGYFAKFPWRLGPGRLQHFQAFGSYRVEAGRQTDRQVDTWAGGLAEASL